MTDHEMLEYIASFDYGVYSVGGKIVIADPIGSPDGYYIEVGSIEEAYREIVDSGVLDGDRPDETDCTNVIAGKECADRKLPFNDYCEACALYWKRAAELAGKPVEQWIKENTK